MPLCETILSDMKFDTNEMQKRGRSRWMLLSVVGTFCVLYLTHIPQANMKVDLALFSFDKVIHAFVYGVLAFLYVMSVGPERSPWVLLGIVMILAGIAGLDEWTQSFVGRSSSMMDFYADMVGICGVVVGKRLIVSRHVAEAAR